MSSVGNRSTSIAFGTIYTPAPGPPPGPVSFHEVLSALNPLQYVPVAGTIYRAATGDEAPRALRDIGTMITGALLGGPVGLITGVGSVVAQRASGIDVDEVGQRLLARLGLGHAHAGPALAASHLPAAVPVLAGPITMVDHDAGHGVTHAARAYGRSAALPGGRLGHV